MGIPYYVASLLRAHKHIQQTCLPGTPLEVDCLGIDFNCFLHGYLKAENPVGSIVTALEDLVTNVVRAKKVYLAFDGLVPYAKMVQQRYRRMKSPEGEPFGFDKHQLSPGTPFMRKLATTLRFLYPQMVISDTLERGEGEHKIFTWLRSLPADERKTTIVYGLDADLVVIALAQSDLSDMKLLREQEQGEYKTLSIPALKAVLPVDVPTFLKMSLQFGNDFMPNLAVFSLREDGYPRALYHAQNRPATAADERKVLLKRAKETERRIVAPDGLALESRFGCHLMDGVLNWDPVCEAYWKTWDWVYHYFTTSEVLDWMWVYPYPEAPLLMTLEDYPRPTSFKWEYPEPPFGVDDQLRFILPEASLAPTGLEPIYPDELYDEGPDSRHPWMRRFAWETDPWVSLPMGTLTTVSEYHLP
jgi:5'-3' exonuclease